MCELKRLLRYHYANAIVIRLHCVFVVIICSALVIIIVQENCGNWIFFGTVNTYDIVVAVEGHDLAWEQICSVGWRAIKVVYHVLLI